MNAAKILQALGKLPLTSLGTVAQLIDTIAHSKNPDATALRALTEAAKVKAFDEAMKARKPRRKR